MKAEEIIVDCDNHIMLDYRNIKEGDIIIHDHPLYEDQRIWIVIKKNPFYITTYNIYKNVIKRIPRFCLDKEVWLYQHETILTNEFANRKVLVQHVLDKNGKYK